MSRKHSQASPALSGLVGTAVIPPAAWIIYSKVFVDHNMPLPDAIPAARARFKSESAGNISYYHDRSSSGRPLLLIHSVNAAASAYEMRPLFEHYRGERPVYAVDLPGYGFSDRADRNYTAEFFEKAIIDLVEDEIGEPVDAVALSLGSEFLARAAQVKPDRFHSITLISPSGFNARGGGRATQRVSANENSDTAYKLLAFPIWGQALFDLIATRRSIQFFLEKSFVGDPPDEFVDYSYLTSHQPGAANVPLYFVSGRLFTPNVKTAVYEKVTIPGLIIYDEDYYSSFDTLPDLLRQKDNWQAARITPTRGLPHWERLPEVIETLNIFWQNRAQKV